MAVEEMLYGMWLGTKGMERKKGFAVNCSRWFYKGLGTLGNVFEIKFLKQKLVCLENKYLEQCLICETSFQNLS